MKNITAEEFFRNKVRELNPDQAVITLSREMITAEQGLRWAHEFHELKNGWISVKDKMPELGEKVLIELQHWNTKGFRYYECKRVDEDDCDWRTVDDNSEISYDWNVLRWMPLPQNQ